MCLNIILNLNRLHWNVEVSDREQPDGDELGEGEGGNVEVSDRDQHNGDEFILITRVRMTSLPFARNTFQLYRVSKTYSQLTLVQNLETI